MLQARAVRNWLAGARAVLRLAWARVRPQLEPTESVKPGKRVSGNYPVFPVSSRLNIVGVTPSLTQAGKVRRRVNLSHGTARQQLRQHR